MRDANVLLVILGDRSGTRTVVLLTLEVLDAFQRSIHSCVSSPAGGEVNGYRRNRRRFLFVPSTDAAGLGRLFNMNRASVALYGLPESHVLRQAESAFVPTSNHCERD